MEKFERRYTLREAAATAPEPVSPVTLRRAIHRHELPAVYVVGRWRIREDDLLKFLKLMPPTVDVEGRPR